MTDDTHSLGACLKHWRLQKGLPLEVLALRTRIPLKYLRALETNDFCALPPIETLPHTLGESLRECRERQNLSIESIAERTRVPLAHLHALEENDLTKLPAAPVIIRAFVDAYLSCLSLQDSQKEEVLIQFARMVEAVYAQPRQEPANPPPHRGTQVRRALIEPMAAFHAQCRERALAAYFTLIDWRATFCRRTISAGQTAGICLNQVVHSAADISISAGQAAWHTITTTIERILANSRLAKERPAVWHHALTAGDWEIRHSFMLTHRDTAPHPDWHPTQGRAADTVTEPVTRKMGEKMWVWMVQYGITILLLLLLGSTAANIPLFKETVLADAKLDASNLVEFIGYGGALFMVWLMGRKATALLDRDRSGFAFLRPLVVPLNALLVASASYKVLLVLVSPFLGKTDRLAYNWIFVSLILAATLWLILTWFLKSAPMLESLEAAGREKRPGGIASAFMCPQCSTTVPNDMKYCGHCGIAVASLRD